MTAPEPEANAESGPLDDASASFLKAQPNPDAIRAACVRQQAVLASLLDRFAATCPGAERAALVSLWSQFYFGRLIVPTIALLARGGGHRRFDLEAVHVHFCPHQGVPVSFHLVEDASRRVPAAALAELVDDHIGPLVSVLHREAGLSRRLLWANAGWFLAWAESQIAWADDARTEVRRALADALTRLPSGRPTSRGTLLLRRVCCLRYQVPGYARCPGTCPLGETEARRAVHRRGDRFENAR